TRPASPATTACVETTSTRRVVNASSCSATGTMFLLFGSTTTASAGQASTAWSSSAVDGFIDWPPATTSCTPRLRKSRCTPSPVATATTAVVQASAAGSSLSVDATVLGSTTH